MELKSINQTPCCIWKILSSRNQGRNSPAIKFDGSEGFTFNTKYMFYLFIRSCYINNKIEVKRLKKIVTIIFLAISLFVVGSSFNTNSKAETGNNKNLIEEIGKFSALDEENQIKAAEILMEKSFGNNYSIVLFKNNDGIGYAILESDNLISVMFGSNRQGYDQFKNYYIVYGEKPKEDYQELEITIEMGNHHDNMEEVIALDFREVLSSCKRAFMSIEGTRVFSDNYNFNE